VIQRHSETTVGSNAVVRGLGLNNSILKDEDICVRSILSGASHLLQPPSEREDLISGYTEDLRRKLHLGTMDVNGHTRVIAQLSQLLETLSLKLGNSALSQQEQDATNLITHRVVNKQNNQNFQLNLNCLIQIY
jgi:hypothetical protein